MRRDRFAQFVARRAYRGLDDPELAADFEAYRDAEARLIVFILAFMVVVVLVLLAVRHAT